MAENVAPSKRRRVAQACSACRARKSRCDGAMPKCSTCREMDFECEYMQSGPPSTVMLGREYVSALERRLKAVEAAISEMQPRESNHPPFLETVSAEPQRYPQSDVINGGTQQTLRRAVIVNAEEVQDPAWNDDDATDGMGAMFFAEEEECGFFGPSSNVAFMRHVSRAVARVYNINANPAIQPNLQTDGGLMIASRPSATNGARSQRKQRFQAGSVNSYTLPPKAETLFLVKRYFSNTGVLFPFIHEEKFLETYVVAERSGFKSVRRTWLGLLNIVLALSTSTAIDIDSDAEKRTQQSETYYQRARGLCGQQTMCGTSLEAVQYLLLTGQYLQGTQRSVQAWTTVGLAIRTAFQLGLHSSEASDGVSPLEREIRTRTFYGCVILDRQLSMTFGRPPAIPDRSVKIPLPQIYGSVTQPECHTDAWKQVSVPFFNATITLYELMWKTIDLCYGGNLGCEKPPGVLGTMAQLFQLEQELTDWKRALPAELTLRQFRDLPVEGDDDLYHREKFGIILTLRFNNIRVLLHRPVLVKFLDTCSHSEPESQERNLLHQIGSGSLQTCIQASMEIISLVNSVVHSTGLRRTILGSYWSSLYYTFNAALVLFASCLAYCNANINLAFLSIPLESLRASLDGAVEALQRLDRGNRTVRRCKEYLERLMKLLDVEASKDAFPGVTAPSSAGAFTPYQPAFGNDIVSSSMANQIGHSPLSIDFAEFMTEVDLEFLNYFSVSDTIERSSAHNQLQDPY